MKKVVIIVLVVVVVLMIVVLVARPGGGGNQAKAPGFVKLIGALTPRKDVTAADMAGQQCWNNTGGLTVPQGAACSSNLPEKANRMRICLAAGTQLSLTVQGDRFGPQKFRPDQLSPCGSGRTTIDLYDDNSKLVVICGLGGPCALQLQ